MQMHGIYIWEEKQEVFFWKCHADLPADLKNACAGQE